ncbi:3'-5' exonuclease [Amycolatopsis acidicola]|uniref:3'-5' exonuclease n=1 Tax=Amycolatopsis acidicola TaxID=2596893 RepID=A0A5N0VNE1_9PSEU|nr:exonuclease domain-containing protein [Amycolatopsis acidicola]KAA9166824.1 3'-5' exonuclease [Amycolatopsis acidicola]
MKPVTDLRLSASGAFPAHTTEFTALELTTTALRPGHVVELGAVRLRADGTVLDEFSTLVNPGWNVDAGPVHVHGLTRRDLDSAPAFGEALGELADLCRGTVLAMHNLPFQQEFLLAELAKAGVQLPALPGVCTAAAAGEALRLPNYQLATVAAALGIGDYPRHLALAKARTCACVVASLITTHGFALTADPRPPELPKIATGLRVINRPETPPEEPGWLSEALPRLPVTDGQPALLAYHELLAVAVTDQDLSPDEARELGALAGEAGIPVRQTHLDFVAALRQVAEDDGVITAVEARELSRIANALAVPEAVYNLRTGARTQTPARVLVLGDTVEADGLRAAVLAAGIQLAKRLTPAVSHLAVADDVPRSEPRLARARDLGIAVLDVRSAWTVLGLVNPAPTVVRVAASAPPPLPGPVGRGQLWASRVLMIAGVLVMAFALVALFGGAPFVAGLFLGAFGVAALLGGWYLSEPAAP